MAGDWIPMRTNLADDEAVVSISVALAMEPDMVVGKLHRLWSWASANTTNGYSKLVTAAWCDVTLLRTNGFMSALKAARWADYDVTGVVTGVRLLKFERWCGNGAKNRLNNARRQARHRSRKSNAGSNAKAVTKARPEKRREEYINRVVTTAAENLPEAGGILGSDPIPTPSKSQLDSEIRTHLAAQSWLIYDHKKHEKFRRCVIALGWAGAVALVDEVRANPAVRDPIAVAEARLGHLTAPAKKSKTAAAMDAVERGLAEAFPEEP